MKYQGEVVQVLEQVWEIYGRICSKRLHPFLSEGVAILERCRELNLSPELKQMLLSMSPATIDRCLQKARFTHTQHGLSTTKPGYLLKKLFPFAPLLLGKVKSLAFWNSIWRRIAVKQRKEPI